MSDQDARREIDRLKVQRGKAREATVVLHERTAWLIEELKKAESQLTAAPNKNAEELKAITERIMTQHWDMSCCRCWVCVEGRKLGCRPRETYLHDKTKGAVLVHDARANDVETI